MSSTDKKNSSPKPTYFSKVNGNTLLAPFLKLKTIKLSCLQALASGDFLTYCLYRQKNKESLITRSMALEMLQRFDLSIVEVNQCLGALSKCGFISIDRNERIQLLSATPNIPSEIQSYGIENPNSSKSVNSFEIPNKLNSSNNLDTPNSLKSSNIPKKPKSPETSNTEAKKTSSSGYQNMVNSNLIQNQFRNDLAPSERLQEGPGNATAQHVVAKGETKIEPKDKEYSLASDSQITEADTIKKPAVTKEFLLSKYGPASLKNVI